jgi:hypothetical protein
MSARALQHVVVCAHHGCAFVDALVDETLTPAEQAMFRAVDRRAFGADGGRRDRIVAAVVDELPVSVAIAGLPAVYALFDDRACFFPVVQGAAPIAVAFAAALEPVATDAARLEGAIARARRRPRRVTGLLRADGVEVACVDDGAIARYQAARAGLGDRPVESVGGGARLAGIGNGDAAWVLATRGHKGVELGSCSGALGQLLQRCTGIDDDAFVSCARALGCDTDDEASELLAELLADGLVQRA